MRISVQAIIGKHLLQVVWNYCFGLKTSPEQMRKRFEFFASVSREKLIKKFPDLKFADLDFQNFKVECVDAKRNPNKAIIYLHGGGYFAGSPAAYRWWTARLSFLCHAKVYAVDYRLCPENPYPAALDDAEATYRKVLEMHGSQNIVIVGDSAGGGLALCLLQQLRIKKLPMPACAVAVSPYADMSGSLPSYQFNSKKDVWLTKAHVAKWGPWYAGNGDLKNPLMSPVFGDFTGCCPMMILVGDQEVLMDDGLTCAQRAKNHGVKVDVVIGEGMQHVWPIAIPFAPEAKKAIKQIANYINTFG